ncbi:hypothetical protein PF008_g7342 [Phytophthora fragariae]|uniref:RxLR effector protein n=1 Tax=Phytophthora fragariae TaxID=53985 RepID=A0A6G0S2S1_9STRA|nr:hypothetical protein PF008_g7342 [Phytophthora fragariae]
MKGSPKKVTLVTSVALVTVAVCASDKRRWPAKPTRRFSARTKVWQRVLREPAYADGWFPATFAAIEPHFSQSPSGLRSDGHASGAPPVPTPSSISQIG